MGLRKYDIINGLANTRGLRRYLEICTPSTGVRFGHVDRGAFDACHRLMYRCPETFDDGLPITFRTAASMSHDLVRAIDALLPDEHRYDIVFVDPWHGYASGIADLHGALCLLRPGGIIVVHDCNPTDPDTVTPEYRDGAWCGLTFQAFVDFVLESNPGGYCVVDTDYGCGVVFTGPPPAALTSARPGRKLVFEWSLAREAAETRWAFFERHRTALLNLVDPLAFVDACGLPSPGPDAATDVPDLSRPPASPDPALRVVAGATEPELTDYRDGWHHYALPDGATEVRLLSDSPQRSKLDRRPLGLAVAGIMLDDRSIDLADLVLTRGWHVDEAGAGYPWRWTDGDASIRLPRGTTSFAVFTTNR